MVASHGDPGGEIIVTSDKDPELLIIEPTRGNSTPKRRSRELLSKLFTDALADDFSQHGREAIEACRTFSPEIYLRIIASLMPKEVKVVNEEQHMSDGELESALKRLLIADINNAIAARSGGTATVIEGERAAETEESVGGISPIS